MISYRLSVCDCGFKKKNFILLFELVTKQYFLPDLKTDSHPIVEL